MSDIDKAAQDIAEIRDIMRSVLSLTKSNLAMTSAIQLAVCAFVEQLAQTGMVDCEIGTDRMHELISVTPNIDGLEEAVAAFASLVEQFQPSEGPAPPRGNKPRLVK